MDPFCVCIHLELLEVVILSRMRVLGIGGRVEGVGIDRPTIWRILADTPSPGMA